ncbi:hypothetical protein ACQP2F_29685 [Actinoplanes sp. CA-030573]|uniref:hypothetical protein n=1 Tax=Actinoplanes sp. CA-030573 TaxID=3239898 RepID=UPI003D8B5E95
MQPVSPYRLGEPLGQCQVGSVWSAVDEQGRPLTVAVLDTAARDQGWRDAFAATVSALAEPGPDRPQYVRADVRAEVPWAAYAGPVGAGAGAERVFESLGQRVIASEPSLPPAPPISGAPVSASVMQATTAHASAAGHASAAQASAAPISAGPSYGSPAPSSGVPVPQQSHSQPSQSQPAQPQPSQSQPSWNTSASVYPASGGSVYQTSSPPDPVSGTPVSPVSTGGGVDQYGLGYAPPSEPNPFSSPQRRIEPSPPRKSRKSLWIALAAVVFVLAGAGTWFVLANRGGDPDPGPAASAGAVPQAVGTVPTGAPSSPGVEPPKSGGWPANWPRYSPVDKVKTLNLEGVGFPVKVPQTWSCTLGARAEGYVKYNCGTAPSDATQVGGELIVRACAAPCDGDQQAEARQNEEAWGIRWIRSGAYAAFGETIVPVDGQDRHALAVVAFYRGESGEVDHEMVFRMTAPVKDAQVLRRVATYIHDTIIF